MKLNRLKIKFASKNGNSSRKLDENDVQHDFFSLIIPRASEPAIFKLNANIDCFDEIFDYLPLVDLASISQICKWLERITGKYFQQNFPALKFRVKRDGMYLDGNKNTNKIHGFDEFVQNLVIRGFLWSSFGDGLKRFRYIDAHCARHLKRIRFENVQLTGREIECIKEIFNNVETVIIDNCRIKRKFYDNFPVVCFNLRRVEVRNFQCNRNVYKRTGNEWLLRSYSKLEYLEWTQTTNSCRIDELKTFFELNPNIHSFSTNSSCLWMSRQLIMDSKVKLQNLFIDFDREGLSNIESIRDLLNELHDREIFKRLHLQFRNCNQRHIESMSLLQTLESLHLKSNENINLCQLNHLKVLSIDSIATSNVISMQIVANQLYRLEQIHFKCAQLEDFQPFIRCSPNLRRIKIDLLLNKEKFKCILNLNAMNAERKLLARARKVTVYIDEEVFLATKWRTGKSEFEFIEIRRTEAWDMDALEVVE